MLKASAASTSLFPSQDRFHICGLSPKDDQSFSPNADQSFPKWYQKTVRLEMHHFPLDYTRSSPGFSFK